MVKIKKQESEKEQRAKEDEELAKLMADLGVKGEEQAKAEEEKNRRRSKNNKRGFNKEKREVKCKERS